MKITLRYLLTCIPTFREVLMSMSRPWCLAKLLYAINYENSRVDRFKFGFIVVITERERRMYMDPMDDVFEDTSVPTFLASMGFRIVLLGKDVNILTDRLTNTGRYVNSMTDTLMIYMVAVRKKKPSDLPGHRYIYECVDENLTSWSVLDPVTPMIQNLMKLKNWVTVTGMDRRMTWPALMDLSTHPLMDANPSWITVSHTDAFIRYSNVILTTFISGTGTGMYGHVDATRIKFLEEGMSRSLVSCVSTSENTHMGPKLVITPKYEGNTPVNIMNTVAVVCQKLIFIIPVY